MRSVAALSCGCTVVLASLIWSRSQNHLGWTRNSRIVQCGDAQLRSPAGWWLSLCGSGRCSTYSDDLGAPPRNGMRLLQGLGMRRVCKKLLTCLRLMIFNQWDIAAVGSEVVHLCFFQFHQTGHSAAEDIMVWRRLDDPFSQMTDSCTRDAPWYIIHPSVFLGTCKGLQCWCCHKVNSLEWSKLTQSRLKVMVPVQISPSLGYLHEINHVSHSLRPEQPTLLLQWGFLWLCHFYFYF